MPDPGVFILVVAAIGIGWGLGRFSRRSSAVEKKDTFPASYYRGLNYLIGQRTDQGIETFVSSLEVNGVTLETHIALGKLMRRKGEVDRAIRIHQNLLGRSSLSAEQQHSAHFELARDYQKAGLLDRAERLLQELVVNAAELRQKSLVLLTDIYDEEKEWQQAIDTGRQLLPKRRIVQRSYEQNAMARRLAYYSCELAQAALDSGDHRETVRQLERASAFDRQCIRAGMLEAEHLLGLGKARQGIKVLERLVGQNPRFMVVVLPLLGRCYEAEGDVPGLHRYLRGFLEQHESTAVALRIAEDLCLQGAEGEASSLLATEMARQPTLRGMSRLIELNLDSTGGNVDDPLSSLHTLIERLGENKPAYRCDDCGFSGQQLHWQCPSCKKWGSVAPIGGQGID